MLGERIPAPKALEWGLINRVVADDAFDAEVDALAERLATGPTALLRRLQAPAQRLACTRGMEEQLELEADDPAGDGRARGDFIEGVQRLPGEARRPSSRGR